jgi:hypothetical protein
MLSGGGSSTPFSLLLPKGAACPGDTATHQFHVDSYVLPASVSPSSVHFRAGWPIGARPLDVSGAGPYFAQSTFRDSARVPAPPVFTWARYARLSLIKSGTYNIGIMCSDANDDPTTYWNTRVDFRADATDPHHLRWVVAGADVPHRSASNLGLIAGLAIAGCVLVALAVLTVRMRGRLRPRE